MTDFSKPLFSTRVSSGNRTIFFDVKSTKEDKPYLKITQSFLQDGEKKRANLTVFYQEFAQFKQALDQALDFIDGHIK